MDMVPSGAGPTSLRPPVAQGDILGILQREQDHTTSLLSLNSSLSSLLISVSRRVVVLESAASTTPPPESEEYKCLQTILTVLREENRELKQEARDKRDSAEASQEAFRSRVSSLERANTDQQDDITSLRAELLETRTQHAQLMVDSNTEVTALQVQVVDLEAQWKMLKGIIVQQQCQLERSGLERRMTENAPARQPPLSRPSYCYRPTFRQQASARR